MTSLQPTTLRGWIERHRARLHAGLFLETAAERLAVFLLAWGGAVLAVKLLWPAAWPHVLWTALLALPVALSAYWTVRRRAFSETDTVALLDRRLAAGGLLMTLSEYQNSAWERELSSRYPRWQAVLLRIRPARFAKFVSLPLLFALAVCFVPLRQAQTEEIIPHEVGRRATERLQEMVEWLGEVHVLTAEEDKEIREAIAELADESDDLPLTHEKWEAIDNLRRRLAQKLEEAERRVAKGRSAAGTLGQDAGSEEELLSLERSEQLEKDMLEALQKLGERGALGDASGDLKEQLQRLLKDRQLPKSLTPEDLAEREQLLNELDEFLKEQAEKLAECRGKCIAARLVDGKLCEGEGECEGGLMFDEEGRLIVARDGQKPGRGGVSRGRGDAPLTWGEESDERGAKFKETVLPPGFRDEQTGEVVGVTMAPPEVDPVATAARDAGREFDAATGRESRRQALRPRHREVVREYFRDGATGGE